MAGSASNWFKPTGGKLKGQAVYVSKAQQMALSGDPDAKLRRQDVAFYLNRSEPDALKAANAELPKGVAKTAGPAKLVPGDPVMNSQFRYRPKTASAIADKQTREAADKLERYGNTISSRNPVDITLADGSQKKVVLLQADRRSSSAFEVRFDDGTQTTMGAVDLARRIAKNAARQAPTENLQISRLTGVKPRRFPSEPLSLVTKVAAPHMAAGPSRGEEVERVRQVGNRTIVQTFIRPDRVLATYEAQTGPGGRLIGLKLTGGTDRDTNEILTPAQVQARIR